MDLQIQQESMEVCCDKIFCFIPGSAERVRVVYATAQEVATFKSQVAVDMKNLGFTGPITEVEGGSPYLVQTWKKGE